MSNEVTKTARVLPALSLAERLYQAAIVDGRAASETKDILRTFKAWTNKEKFNEMRVAYFAGHIVGYTERAKSPLARERATAIVSLSKYDSAKVDDKHRTQFEELAYQSAKASWFRVCEAAGKPKREQAARGKTVAPNASPTETEQPLGTLKCETIEQVATFMERIHGVMVRFQQVNAGVKMGDYGTLMREFCEGYTKLQSSTEKEREAA
jgi:hypothetical protein